MFEKVLKPPQTRSAGRESGGAPMDGVGRCGREEAPRRPHGRRSLQDDVDAVGDLGRDVGRGRRDGREVEREAG